MTAPSFIFEIKKNYKASLRIEKVMDYKSQRNFIQSLHLKRCRPSEIFKIVKNYGIKRNMVYKTLKRIAELGSIENRPRSGRPRSVRTPLTIKIVRERVRRDPRRSMRNMAIDLGISHESVRNLVKSDLGLKSLKRTSAQHLSLEIRRKRLERCRALKRRHEDWNLENVLFSDEKIFTVEATTNRQNDRVLCPSVSNIPENIRYVGRSQKPASVMVWAGVSANQRTNLVFVEKGVKINSHTYRDLILEPVVKQCGHKLFQDQHWIFQQDGAPSHTANMIQEWCRREIPEFITKEEWPPSSPDLNPMDYAAWGILEDKACAKSHSNVDALKRSLLSAWSRIPQEHFRAAVTSFPRRLSACISARGGYFE